MTALDSSSPSRLPRLSGMRDMAAQMLRDPFVLAMFFSLLLIGADRVAIRPGGFTLRAVFPVLMTAMALLYTQRGKTFTLPAVLTALFLLQALAGTLSIFDSYDAAKSIGYTIWVLFDYFVIIALCFNFAKNSRAMDVLSIWFLVYRIHVVLLLCEVVYNITHGALGRPHVWFYESSYLAIFMTGYFGAALYLFLRDVRRHAFDLIFSAIGLLATTSATGMFGLIFATLLNFFFARHRLQLLVGALILAGSVFAVLYTWFSETVYFHLIVGFLLRDDLSFDVILNRGGNRVLRALVGWEAFMHHPWTGIGIGADATFMSSQPFPESAQRFVHEWEDNAIGEPFSNILVEVVGTMGVAGLLPFLGIIGYAAAGLRTSLKLRNDDAPVAVALFLAFFSIFLALQFESTVLRYYLWTPLGLGLGVLARARAASAEPPA